LSYISGDLAEWLDAKDMTDVRRAPYHPQTQGKIERQKEEGHQTLKNRIPANVYFGRGQEILEERRRIKRQALEHQRLLHRKIAE
jgi:putative transposase